MATTGQQVLDDAAQRSGINDVSAIDSAIILRALTRYERRVYLRASKLQPEYFGTTGDTSTRAAYTDSWNIGVTPGNVAALIKAVVAAKVGTLTPTDHAVGAEINLISGRTAFPLLQPAPRAYLRGRRIVGYGTELGQDSSNMITRLTLTYAELPAAVTALGNALNLPDEWTDLVVLPLAKLLALRDRRMDELEAIQAEYVETLALFDEAVQAYDVGLTRPIDATPVRAPK